MPSPNTPHDPSRVEPRHGGPRAAVLVPERSTADLRRGSAAQDELGGQKLVFGKNQKPESPIAYRSDSCLTRRGGLKSPVGVRPVRGTALITYDAPSRALILKPWV